MSAAATYASQIATQVAALNAIQQTVPVPFIGPGGLMVASVNNDGNCVITFGQQQFIAPAAVMVAFSNWITATFAG